MPIGEHEVVDLLCMLAEGELLTGPAVAANASAETRWVVVGGHVLGDG